MLIYFERPDAGSVAINPHFVMLVEATMAGANIVMADGGTTKVTGNYMEVIGRLNGELK
jgi:hypothetical protein